MSDKKERLLIYGVIVIVAAMIIFMIVIIWKPKSSNSIEANLNKIEITGEYENVQKSSYEEMLKRLLLIPYYDELYTYIDQDWVTNDMKMDKAQLQEWLVGENIITRVEPQILECTLVQSEDMYIYRYGVANGSTKKFVLINEKKPGEFTISFEQNGVSKLEGTTHYTMQDDMHYECKIVSVLSNVMQFDITVKNDSDLEHYYSMKDNYSIALVLDDGTSINASDISCAAGDEVNLWPNNSFDVRVTFFVSIDKQNQIDGIKFTNAFDAYKKISPYISLKEGGN